MTHLLNLTLVKNGQAIAHGQGFLLIMGDKNEGNAQLPLNSL
jgi:hypothetical protein